MSAQLAWTVDDRAVETIVEVHGDLRIADTSPLRKVLLKCLAEQPAALLLDLSRMSLVDSVALSVFAAVAWQATRWPGTPVLLCAPRPETEAVLRRRPSSWLPVYPSVSDALRLCREGPVMPPTISDQLLPVMGAARHARNLTTEACLRWDLAALVGPATLIIDELVSNGVEHAGTMMTLLISHRSHRLHLAVRDGSADPPRLRPPAPVTSALRGRGLLLVDAMCAHWGWLPSADGKVVWATLAIEP